MDLNTFRNAAEKATDRGPTDPSVKWPVRGYIIDNAKRENDTAGDFIMLEITGADGTHTYALRPGDAAGLAFAEELYREVAEGLIVIEGT